MPTRSSEEASEPSSPATFVSANEHRLSSSPPAALPEPVLEEHREIEGIAEELEAVVAMFSSPRDNGTPHSSHTPSTPKTPEQLAKKLERAMGKIEELENGLQNSLIENGQQDRVIVALQRQVLKLKNDAQEQRLKVRRRDAHIEMLGVRIKELEASLETKCEAVDGGFMRYIEESEARTKELEAKIKELVASLETKCQAVDASFMRMPCFNMVCTHVSNDKYDEDEVLRAIGREGVEKERLSKSCVLQSMAAPDSEFDVECRIPKDASLEGQSMAVSGNNGSIEVPPSDLSLGAPLLAVPQGPLSPEAIAVSVGDSQQPSKKRFAASSEGLKSLPELAIPSPKLETLGTSKSPSLSSKATPISMGYFERPAYLDEVKEKIGHIVNEYQQFPRGTIKNQIECLSCSLLERANLASLSSNASNEKTEEDRRELGKELNAVDIQRARQRFDAYAPAWEDQETLMQPILHLANMDFKKPRALRHIKDSPCSLGSPAMPIPLPLVVEELLNKVEKDGRMLHGAQEYAKMVKLWKQDAQLREELDEKHIKGLQRQVSILKSLRGGETTHQRLERLRKENDRLRREGHTRSAMQ